MCEIVNSSEFQCGPFGGKELVFVGSKWDTTLQKFDFFFFENKKSSVILLHATRMH